MMKKFFVLIAVAVMTALSADAQTSLVGRQYHNPNIMADMYKDVERQIADMKVKALKAAMAVMPAVDMPYIIKGNMVILQDEEENDTLYISAQRRREITNRHLQRKEEEGRHPLHPCKNQIKQF